MIALLFPESHSIIESKCKEEKFHITPLFITRELWALCCKNTLAGIWSKCQPKRQSSHFLNVLNSKTQDRFDWSGPFSTSYWTAALFIFLQGNHPKSHLSHVSRRGNVDFLSSSVSYFTPTTTRYQFLEIALCVAKAKFSCCCCLLDNMFCNPA